MPFGQIVSRGFSAANGIPVGLLCYFLLLGVQQGANVVVGGLFSPESFQVKPGEEPSPELLGLMAYGCASCVWALVVLLATPWVTGGVVGQMRERMVQPEGATGKFSEHAGRFYQRMLILALIYLVLMLVIWGAMMAVGAVIFASTVEPGEEIRPDQWQQMNRHPANIASAVVLFLAFNVMALVWSLAQAIVVVDEKGSTTALGDALRFYSQHASDALKLFLLLALLGLVYWATGPLLAAFNVESLAVRAVIGVIVALYFPYVIMVSLGCATSLYLARSAKAGSDSKAEFPFSGGTHTPKEL